MSGTLQAYQASVKGILASNGVDPTGLVGAWPWWANSFGDHSGQGNDGTKGGNPQFVDGALELDGDDSVQTPPDAVGATGSVFSWAHTAALTGDEHIFTHQATHDRVYLKKLNGDEFVLGLGVSANIPTGFEFTIDWHFVGMTWNSGSWVARMDGQTSTGSYNGTIDMSLEEWSIGSWKNSNFFWIGKIGSGFVFTRALTATETTALHNLGRL